MGLGRPAVLLLSTTEILVKASLSRISGVYLARSLPSWLGLNTVLQIAGAGLGLAGQHLINQQNELGFVMWLGSNAALIWLQFRTRLFVLVLLHATYFGLCIQGLLNWTR